MNSDEKVKDIMNTVDDIRKLAYERGRVNMIHDIIAAYDKAGMIWQAPEFFEYFKQELEAADARTKE